MRLGIGAAPEGLQHPTAMPVINDEDGDQGGLGMQPATGETIAEPQPEAEDDSQEAKRRHELEQLAGHRQQALALGMAVGRHHGQVDENARQVEQAGEPGYGHPDMERFYDEHAFLLALAMPSTTVG